MTERPNTLSWRDSGLWLRSDTHIHYRLEGMDEVVAGAAPYCDVLAFTEHSHIDDAFERQIHEIERVRDTHPDLILVNGTEYNTLGNQHAALLVPGGSEGMPFFRDFLKRFDSHLADREITEDDFLAGLRYLSSQGEGDWRPSVIFNHPKREPDYWTGLIQRAFECGPAVLGICGSSRPPGRGDREVWPWLSNVGGLYDDLLDRGHRVVTTAESHIHRHNIAQGGVECWPGEYRRTFVYCPDRTEAGFFSGLRSGACYFVLGDIVEDVDFRVSTTGGWAMPGERLAAASGQSVTVRVEVTEKADLEGLELLGNVGGTPASVARVSGNDLVREGGRTVWQIAIDAPSALSYLRLRGSAPVDKPYSVQAWFYTNPIWIDPGR